MGFESLIIIIAAGFIIGTAVWVGRAVADVKREVGVLRSKISSDLYDVRKEIESIIKRNPSWATRNDILDVIEASEKQFKKYLPSNAGTATLERSEGDMEPADELATRSNIEDLARMNTAQADSIRARIDDSRADIFDWMRRHLLREEAKPKPWHKPPEDAKAETGSKRNAKGQFVKRK